MDGVVQYALQAVWCKYASVVLITKSRLPEVLAATDTKLAELYRLQIEAGQGPLLTTIAEEATVYIPDIATEDRWSDSWRAQLAQAGFASAVHLPLMVAGRARAVLSLYSDKPHGFDADDLAVAHILAEHASVAISTARHNHSMTQAVDARRLVGQAIGILMERFQLDSDRTFEVLKRYSQDSNRKLRAVADEIIATRELPDRK
ncbi:GAF and ANTAR domain-containing protein [Kribbella sp. NPDC056861]|uniref:GAF and ANTAR domain-containing protein n=1 Tax=Kribbella sp. NPDC056861 TaxID=3154857 RepID=UPI0034188F4A